MKIIAHTQTYKNRNNYNNNNIKFKALSPEALANLKKVTEKPENKKLFIKLSAFLGLSNILTWINSLKNDDKNNVERKLEILDTIWNYRTNQLFLNPKTQDKYIELTSNADKIESLIFAKGQISGANADFNSKDISLEEQDLFLNPESNEVFLTSSAERSIKSIKNQIAAILIATKEQRDDFLRKLDNKLNSLVKEVEIAKTSELTANLYEKLSNILRNFSITSSFEDIDYAHPVEIQDEIKIKRTFNSKEEEFDNAKNNFIDEILAPYFDKNNSNINSEDYNDNMDFIIKTYNSYIQKNPEVGELFLNLLSKKNINPEIEQYKSFINDKKTDIKFLNFYKLQEFKRFNGGESLTKDEFDFLDGVKNNTMAFFDVIPGLNGQKYLIVNFTKNSSLNERLKLVSDVYKIGYNKIDDEIVSRDITGNIVMEDIIKELAIILARSIEKNLTDDYSTILNYLKIDKNELMPKIKKVIDMQDYSPANKDNFRTLMETAENIIYSNLDPTRKKRLITLLNNDKFDNFMTSTHARMRFLTRNVLMNEENHNRQTKTLNRILEEQIDNLNNELLSLTNCRIYNYKNQESNKNGVRIKIGNTVMGLNPQGGIHTIYYTET